MFSSGDQFNAFCETISADTKSSKPTLLLINGDFVDFLAEPEAHYWNGEIAECYLSNIARRRAFKPVFDGLANFVSNKGAHLVVVLGNHDIELALPDVREQFINLVTRGDESLRSKIEFAFDGEGYRFEVAGATALATHGNEVDKFNFTRFDTLSQIIRELSVSGQSETAANWKPSAGTVFVIDAINKIKRNFPFVDLLKPEEVTFLTLVILAPKNLTVADEFASMVATAAVNEIKRPASERRFLEFDPGSPKPVNRRSSAIEMLANEYVSNPDLNQDELIYGVDEGSLGLTDWVEAARNAVSELVDRGVHVARDVRDQMRDAAKDTHAGVLRRSLMPLLGDESPQVRIPGKSDKDLLKVVRREYDVVFTGHTHARRFCSIDSNVGWLVNTGTWAGLMHFGEADVQDANAFRRIYDLLMAGDREELVKSKWHTRECPVAVLEKKGTDALLSLQHVDLDGNLKQQDLSGKEFETTI